MTWYFNFCAPFIPNDPTINFHRYVQVALLVIYTLCYAAVYTYYHCWGPMPLESDSANNKEEAKAQKKEKESESQSNESDSQSSDKDKVSIKIDEHANESCVELKKGNSTWDRLTRHKTEGSGNEVFENVTLAQIENYFPIVYGHFAVAMGVSIMYTPYAEQSIACLLYILLSIPLLIVNARRYIRSINIVWGLMAVILLFIFTCGLLEVGQSNWDVINNTCFATEYISLYDS